MDPDVVDAFIQASYEGYNAQVGSEFGAGGVYGIFSDEPQTARYVLPGRTSFRRFIRRNMASRCCRSFTRCSRTTRAANSSGAGCTDSWPAALRKTTRAG